MISFKDYAKNIEDAALESAAKRANEPGLTTWQELYDLVAEDVEQSLYARDANGIGWDIGDSAEHVAALVLTCGFYDMFLEQFGRDDYGFIRDDAKIGAVMNDLEVADRAARHWWLDYKLWGDIRDLLEAGGTRLAGDVEFTGGDCWTQAD